MQGLACPRCRQPLTPAGGKQKLRCIPCKVDFPMLGDVAWLWPEPGNALLDWRNRYNRLLAELEHSESAAAAEAHKHSAERLQNYAAALTRHRQQVTELLQPLATGQTLARETHLALRTQLPQHHVLDAYASNILRDWAWGAEENQKTLDCLAGLLERSGVSQVERMLVLGSGAGRLSLDLHNSLSSTETIALDSNPLLSLIAANMFKGATLSWEEFPRAPSDPESLFVSHQLTGAPAPITMVCADALNPPIEEQSIDCLVTPWLIDVIDAPFTTQIRRWSTLLKPGGIWLNHGSLAFNATSTHQRLGSKDIAAQLEANGFTVIEQHDELLPYLQSPAERQHRQELTHSFVARRVTQAQGGTQPKQKIHAHQPAWLADTSQPVPQSEAFKLQITTTRMHAFIMGLLDGQRSIQDIAKVMEAQRLMPAAEAEQAIRQFVSVMLEEARAQDRLY